MLFYRVENNDKHGPYTGGIPVTLMEFLEKNHVIKSGFDESYLVKHPNPGYDDLLAPIWIRLKADEMKKYIFGFSSLEALFDWFHLDADINFFKEYGFHVSIYESDSVVHGEKQSIADKNTLKLIEIIQF